MQKSSYLKGRTVLETQAEKPQSVIHRSSGMCNMLVSNAGKSVYLCLCDTCMSLCVLCYNHATHFTYKT